MDLLCFGESPTHAATEAKMEDDFLPCFSGLALSYTHTELHTGIAFCRHLQVHTAGVTESQTVYKCQNAAHAAESCLVSI